MKLNVICVIETAFSSCLCQMIESTRIFTLAACKRSLNVLIPMKSVLTIETAPWTFLTIKPTSHSTTFRHPLSAIGTRDAGYRSIDKLLHY